ncbi:50S ribosomal protein L24 [Buchnera aphidicola]|uniref:50S ribosomal protein L24 n=1 Tax=Buchnera aphidicola TaxID=9 RepID=UPI0031B8769C
MSLKLNYNDKVIIITGKYKGKIGFISNIVSSKKVIVKGINLVTKHQKPIPSQNKIGSIIKKEACIDISNIAIFNTLTNKADKIIYKFKKGKKVRFFKSNGKELGMN